jgi:hypothetical protein
MHHARMSKTAVAFLLPILSVIGPEKKENSICISMFIVTRNPIRESVNPSASIYTEIYGMHRFMERPQSGSV